MAAYIIVQIKVTREQGWPEYRAAFVPLIQRFGGRLLVVDPAVEVLEGTHDGRPLVAIEFPSMEAIHSFWHSAEYAEVKKLREGSGELDVWAVPGFEPP